MSFDNDKQNGVFMPLKKFPSNNSIPGVSGALNTPPAATPGIGGPWTNYIPTRMAPNTDPPPNGEGVFESNKPDGIIDSGDNGMTPFKMPLDMNPSPGAGASGGLSDEKQSGQAAPGLTAVNPFRNPY